MLLQVHKEGCSKDVICFITTHLNEALQMNLVLQS